MQVSSSERAGMIRMAKRHVIGFLLLVLLCVWGGIDSDTDFLRILWAIIGTTMVVFMKDSADFLCSLWEAKEVEEE